MKDFIVFVAGEEGKAVYASSLDRAKEYMLEFAKEPGVQSVYIYKYKTHGEYGFKMHDSLDGSKPQKRKRNYVQTARSQQKWTPSDDATLINLTRAVTDKKEIAKELDRSLDAITSRIWTLKREGRLH